MDKFLQELLKTHKVETYVMPLLRINFRTFAGFVHAYVNGEGTHLCVETTVSNTRQSLLILDHSRLLKIEGQDEWIWYWFSIPPEWWPDVRWVIKGRYSLLTPAAKEMIRANSGLLYQVADENGMVFTDYRLLALDRDPQVRRKWEELIQPNHVDLRDMDLMSPPSEREFREFTP